MSKVKIRSNPYLKVNEILIEDKDEWKPIIENSDLNNSKFKTGFFAFIIKDMLDILLKEKRDVDCILFEGTQDDYNILYELIKNHYENISLIQENTYLNNANDIIKGLKEIFASSHDLIFDSVGNNKQEVEKDIEKFVDASNDIIPLCIIGNYSSGKSTFINSLIGMDILPSGSKPLTQNICKILKSKHKINSYIRFEFNSQKHEITYSNNDYEITSFDVNNPILVEIINELDKLEKKSLQVNLNKSIGIINKHNDVITKVEIEVPFRDGILQSVNKSFVIFDTPGSDTATFTKHKEVLKNELNELTNGMLIFVVEKLDNDANDELFKMIKEIEEIDLRFTMIVFNKADNEELPEGGGYSDEEEEELKRLSVPRNLYSNGIYYLSSIMGLGSKINNEFVSKFNKETFLKKKDEYSNPASDFYIELYKYDIMPAHLKKEMIEKSDLEHSKIYVNSGLFAVEYEIGKFANEYSSYNKCRQSKIFFEKIIDITSKEIEMNKEKSEKDKKDIEKLLSNEINELMNEVKIKKEKLFNNFIELYIDDMSKEMNIIQKNSNYDENKIKELESNIRKNKEITLGLENVKVKSANNEKKIDSVIENDIKEFEELEINGKIIKAPSMLFHGFNKIFTMFKNAKSEYSLNVRINIATSDELFEKIKKEYIDSMKLYKVEISNLTKEYCEKGTKNIKDDLLVFINKSSNLNEKQKNALSNIIANYRDIQIERDANKIFVKSELQKWPIFISMFFNEIDTNKVVERYNKAIYDCITEIFEKVQESNFITLKEWLDKLINEIRKQIVSLSPELSTRAEKIKEIENRIEELIKNKYELNNYYERVDNLMSWKSL